MSYSKLTILILIVTMRSWIQMGLVTFIPFYYINYLKGDPLLAGKMVTTFLISGTAGTLLGARLADRWGHKFFLTLTMLLMIPLLILFLQVQGWGAFLVLALSGFVLIASFSVTVVMAQDLLPGQVGRGLGFDGRVCHRDRWIRGNPAGSGGRYLGSAGSLADHDGHAHYGFLVLFIFTLRFFSSIERLAGLILGTVKNQAGSWLFGS